ncbi:von Willebrand factor type A domain-containing protein [Paramicrobacterium humi]|uniref:von Willebrand factor type A domain-containing protein n=1 Tax=Paramicrobacterium humi TaxID=640635 RepID=A0A1H4PI34_9MICO|nr:VWA domain-containing protein [Microbacterium humi]SEC07085.1 von Willebrand factor type A domain-containing protein [Microbacterium humi]
MELINGWMPLAWLAAIAAFAVVIVLVRSRRRRASRSAARIAHAERLAALPGYATARSRLRALLIAGVAVAGVLLLSAIALSSRIVAVTSHEPELHNRDIVLCLDTSGSMTDYDVAILDTFATLVDSFEGERIGLTIFNASAVTVFPLTTDYDYVTEQMSKLRENMADPDTDYAYTDGTLLGDGSSLIGDGLASCVMRFDNLDEERSRSIIFATDNFVAGKQLISLPEAGRYASENGVTVFGVNPGDAAAKDYIAELATEMRETVESTGGSYYALADPDAIPGIVHAIQSEEATAMTGPPQMVRTDQPVPYLWIALLSTIALMLLGWRLRR